MALLYSNHRPENAAYLDEPDLQAVLLVLRELGFADVPARCKELSAERFNHAPAIINQFQVYAQSYRPNKLGELPAVFREEPDRSRDFFDDCEIRV